MFIHFQRISKALKVFILKQSYFAFSLTNLKATVKDTSNFQNQKVPLGKSTAVSVTSKRTTYKNGTAFTRAVSEDVYTSSQVGQLLISILLLDVSEILPFRGILWSDSLLIL